MGDMIAHMTAAQMLRRGLAESEPLLDLYLPAFFLGNIGPDIFFYSPSLLPYGDMLQVDVDAAAMFRIAQAEARMPGCHQPLLFSWYAGLLSHYCMDKYLHPYVESCISERQKAGVRGSNMSLHGMCETEIDIALYRRQTGRPISNLRTDFFRLSAEQTRVVAEVWRKIIASLFHETVQLRQVTGAIHTIPVLNYLQLHGTAVTKPVAKLVGRLLPGDVDPSTKIKRDHPCEAILNDAHREWRDPRHPEHSYRHSVEELLAHAAQEAQGLISLAFHGGSVADSPLITREFDFGYFEEESPATHME